MGTYDNIQKITTQQGDDYTVRQGDYYFLDYPYFKHYNNLTAIDFCKQEELDTDTIEIQQIAFTGNLNQRSGSTMILLLKKQKKLFYIFRKELRKKFILFCFDIK